MKSKLLDQLAMEIDANRKHRRIWRIKEAFEEYAEWVRLPWWKKAWKRIKS